MQDPHWSLYTNHCTPCLANFTYIVHLENKEEEDLVLNMTGLAEMVGGVRTVNPTSGGSSSGVLREFISLLSCHNLVRLRDRYWPDLLLFQYDISEMFQWTRGGKPGGCS